MTRRELSCDEDGVLWVTTIDEDEHGTTMRVFKLGPILLACWAVPEGLEARYEELRDQHRDAFDPRAEAEAAWRRAKGL
jgi:hypothetical protein